MAKYDCYVLPIFFTRLTPAERLSSRALFHKQCHITSGLTHVIATAKASNKIEPRSFLPTSFTNKRHVSCV